MRSLACALVVLGLAVTAWAQTGTQTYKGHLVDSVCALNHGKEAGYAEKHERSCNLMDGCIKSGFSLITADQKVIAFDQKGNEQALALIKRTDKATDFKVRVTGRMEGDTLIVESIKVE